MAEIWVLLKLQRPQIKFKGHHFRAADAFWDTFRSIFMSIGSIYEFHVNVSFLSPRPLTPTMNVFSICSFFAS